MKKELSLTELYKLLDQHVSAGTEWPADTVFEMMLGAILVQNTTWHNTTLSLALLDEATAFDPEVIADLSTEELKRLIYSSGFHKRKTQLILDYFGWLKQYEFDLEKIKRKYKGDLRERLLKFNGIGNETADVLLLYAFEQPVFVADTYALKLFRHLGSEYSTDYLTLKKYVERTGTFTLKEWQKFHGLIDEYGKVYLRGKQESIHPHWEEYFLVEPDLSLRS